MESQSKERQILMVMRKVLAAVIKDTTPAPGLRHPLSDATIRDIRQCFALIAARERELADEQGCGVERPYYADETPAATVVPIAGIGKKNDQSEQE